MNGTLTLTRIRRRVVVVSTLTVLSTLLFMSPPIVMIIVDMLYEYGWYRIIVIGTNHTRR